MNGLDNSLSNNPSTSLELIQRKFFAALYILRECGVRVNLFGKHFGGEGHHYLGTSFLGFVLFCFLMIVIVAHYPKK